MDNQHISYFKVENFKRFEALEIENIGQFNLIVGNNNVGKTSVLESLLFDENKIDLLQNLHQILCTRNLHIHGKYEENYLKFIINGKQLKYTYQVAKRATKSNISLRVKEYQDLDSSQIVSLKRTPLPSPIPKYWTEIKINRNEWELDFLYLDELVKIHDRYIPFIPFHQGYNDDLVLYYSKLTNEDKNAKNIFLKSLQIFIDDIENIEPSMLIPEKILLSVILKNRNKPMPMQSFGDGAVKMCRIFLEMVMSRNKRLMIDEIDTGVHYSKMVDFWKSVLLAGVENNVQLFMSTHSKECINSFQLALYELNLSKDGRIIALDEKIDKKVFATTYFHNEFTELLNDNIEIR